MATVLLPVVHGLAFLLVARVVGLSPSRRQSTTILWASSVPLCNVLVAGLWLLGVRVGLLSLLCPRWGQLCHCQTLAWRCSDAASCSYSLPSKLDPAKPGVVQAEVV